jgi:hypothetical protein
MVLRRAAEAMECLGIEGATVRLRARASATLAQSLTTPATQDALNEELRKSFGPSVSAHLEIEELPPEPAGPAASSPAPGAPIPPAKAEPAPGLGPDQAVFENDPLIRAALDAFQARIVALKAT